MDVCNAIAGQTPGRCAPHELACDGSRCVPLTARCDGVQQCRDGSDESLCGAFTRFTCFCLRSTESGYCRVMPPGVAASAGAQGFGAEVSKKFNFGGNLKQLAGDRMERP